MTLARNDEELPRQLRNLRNDSRFGLVSVEPGSEGVLAYRSVTRLATDTPALEIPHPDPYLNENPGITFENLLAEYGCTHQTVDGVTYVYPVADQELEQKAFLDIDRIKKLADTGLLALRTEDDITAKQMFEQIHEIASTWEDEQ